MEHFTADKPVIVERETADGADGVEDDETVTGIKELLDTRVRLAVAQDGGDITFEGYEEDRLLYMGTLRRMSSSTATLKHGIENMLKYYIPEIVEFDRSISPIFICRAATKMLRCKIQVNFREILTLFSAIDESRDIPGVDLHRPTTER